MKSPGMPETDTAAVEITAKVNKHGNWMHQFEVTADKALVPPENFSYRHRMLNEVFGTLLAGRSLLVLDEASGVFPALASRAGVAPVAASSSNEQTCELIREVVAFLDAPAEVVNSKMVGFHEAEPYVDMAHGEAYEFLLALDKVWPMFGAAGHSFDAVVEACAFLVTDGVVFDWTDAEWASPPPPPEYERGAFIEALRRKFEYVTGYSDWLVVAAGKRPPAGDDAGEGS